MTDSEKKVIKPRILPTMRDDGKTYNPMASDDVPEETIKAIAKAAADSIPEKKAMTAPHFFCFDELSGSNPQGNQACPWCQGTRWSIDHDDIVSRTVTGYDPDNGPVYYARCDGCGARGPLVGWAADAFRVLACRTRAELLAIQEDPSHAAVDTAPSHHL